MMSTSHVVGQLTQNSQAFTTSTQPCKEYLEAYIEFNNSISQLNAEIDEFMKMYQDDAFLKNIDDAAVKKLARTDEFDASYKKLKEKKDTLLKMLASIPSDDKLQKIIAEDTTLISTLRLSETKAIAEGQQELNEKVANVVKDIFSNKGKISKGIEDKLKSCDTNLNLAKEGVQAIYDAVLKQDENPDIKPVTSCKCVIL